MQKMQKLVRQAMKDGASGLSTSLRYGPGTYATTEEIVALARQIKPFGGFYATHMRDEGTRILEAVEESLQIGQQAGIPVHISHHKISSASVFGLTRLTLARIDKARAAGRDVTLDQYPYGAGSGGMDLYVPQWSLSGGMDAFRERLKQPKVRGQIEAGVKDLLLRKIYEAGQSSDNPAHTAAALSRIRVARATHDESLEGKTLTRPLVELRVTESGGISGTGAVWDVSGQWVWKGGYFCRSLIWGDDDLGYNCQEVAVNGGKIRFTSDKGAGQSAVFSLK